MAKVCAALVLQLETTLLPELYLDAFDLIALILATLRDSIQDSWHMSVCESSG